MLIRDLKDGDELDRVLLVRRELETRTRRDGAEYLRVVFADRARAARRDDLGRGCRGSRGCS